MTVVEQNLELARRAVDAFNAAAANLDSAGDPPAGLYTEDPEIVPLRGALEGTVYTGRSSWKEFWDDIRESWVELGLEVEAMEAVGSGVLAVAMLRGTSRETGVPVGARVAFAVHVRGGLIWRNAVHLDEADARRELEAD